MLIIDAVNTHTKRVCVDVRRQTVIASLGAGSRHGLAQSMQPLTLGSDQIADTRTPSSLRRHRWVPSGGYEYAMLKTLSNLARLLEHGEP